MGTKKVAIACQGGGTHAAFTWGVLTTILEAKKRWDARPEDGDTFDIVAISGTSAGALCALATWYGLAPNTADSSHGTIDKAIERLNFLWTNFAATTPVETAHNQIVGTLLEWKSKGMPFPGSNPYGVTGDLGLAGLSMLGARRQYLEFPALLEALCPNFATIDWPGLAKARRRVMVGAIEVLSGNFEVFDSDKTLEQLGLLADERTAAQYENIRWRMRRAISLEGVAASGTLPGILPAQEIRDMVFPTPEEGRTVTRSGYYWDGLYSQNPPVRDLLDVGAGQEKPDEIWVVRINPQEFNPTWASIGLDDIRDRENDLAGNLSLNQELEHILTVNKWIEAYGNSHPPLNDRKVIQVRTIKMTRETAWGLRHTSKFDRSPGHLARLRDEGQMVASQWLADWRTLGKAFASYPDDARYPETA
ncbi:patatin-like phospholipase family protein [Accumulibacter sp.]|uniref:patatin-like phospholipase family protein n=1 Tax=Accumulibacter sp. TaxID=2053492 RepID=UPI0025F30B19|nr:patatin-like phospholipase family protein [Accumulibacter sp.]MCM8595607.1 patatin-like phospholipase family protein [Accumulibacter sp.]MDS4049754.1 patatin-like phospholipase family protein [Accumulibacter sp.]